jgi:predicted RNA binding protein YcfA (HicA-like mRNA interferase family)
VKLPRDVSGTDAVKALRRLGFVVVRQQGSHIRLSKGGVHVTVPNHHAILPKTLQNVLRQAGGETAATRTGDQPPGTGREGETPTPRRRHESGSVNSPRFPPSGKQKGRALWGTRP